MCFERFLIDLGCIWSSETIQIAWEGYHKSINSNRKNETRTQKTSKMQPKLIQNHKTGTRQNNKGLEQTKQERTRKTKRSRKLAWFFWSFVLVCSGPLSVVLGLGRFYGAGVRAPRGIMKDTNPSACNLHPSGFGSTLVSPRLRV